MSPVEVFAVGAEGRDLILPTVLDHEDNTELHADRNGAREKRLHLLRARRRCDIEVMRHLAH
jgi:hypothetical protein